MLDKAKGFLERINWPLTILIIAIIWLAVGFGLLCTYNLWDWLVLYGFATWVLAGGVVFAIWQIIVTRENTNRQLEASRRSTNAQTAVSIFQELRKPEIVEKFRSIYDLPYDFSNPEDFKILGDSRKKDIEYILDRFDVLAVLVDEKIIDGRLAIDAYAGVVVLRCWYKLHQYIKKVREERGYFGDNVEAFTRLSLDYFKEEGIQVKFHTKGEEDKAIDLIKELEKEGLRPRSLDEIKKEREKDN